MGADFDGIQAQNLLSEDAFGRLGLGWDWGWLEGGWGLGLCLLGQLWAPIWEWEWADFDGIQAPKACPKSTPESSQNEHQSAPVSSSLAQMTWTQGPSCVLVIYMRK